MNKEGQGETIGLHGVAVVHQAAVESDRPPAAHHLDHSSSSVMRITAFLQMGPLIESFPNASTLQSFFGFHTKWLSSYPQEH